jgi:hypothetical protein
MQLYKFTQKDNTTFGGCKWGKGATHKATGDSKELCSNGYIHACVDPYLAEFSRYLWADDYRDVTKLNLWEGEGIPVKTDGLKIGCKELTTLKRIRKPRLTLTQRREIAIRISLLVLSKVSCEDETYKFNIAKYRRWAKDWLSGKNRIADATADTAAHAAAYAAHAAYVAYTAADVAYAAHAAYAAHTAADAAYTAAHVAYAAHAAYAAYTAADVAYAAHAAADAVRATRATYATYAAFTQDVLKIIYKVIKKPCPKINLNLKKS